MIFTGCDVLKGCDASALSSAGGVRMRDDVSRFTHVPSCCAAGLQDIRLGIGYIEYVLDAGCTGSLRYGRDGAHEKVEMR